MVRAGYILACYQTKRSNPRGFRDLLFYLCQCNTSEEHRDLGGGICMPWAQTQPLVAEWEAEPHRRQSTTDSQSVAFVFYVKSTLYSGMLQPAFKLWGLGIAFLKILSNASISEDLGVLHHASSCLPWATVGISQEKSLWETQWKAQFFHKAFSPRCIPFMLCYLLLRLILFPPIY